jgi:hypothetical protein
MERDDEDGTPSPPGLVSDDSDLDDERGGDDSGADDEDGTTSPPGLERGARRTPITKDMMVALQVEFGPACARFVHANLGLGGGTSVERWLRADRRPFEMGIHEDNFREAADVMAASMKRLNITGPIMHQMSEDETALQDSVDYHPQSDSIVGFCGPVCAHGHHLVTKCK